MDGNSCRDEHKSLVFCIYRKEKWEKSVNDGALRWYFLIEEGLFVLRFLMILSYVFYVCFSFLVSGILTFIKGLSISELQAKRS